jgi:hypothetical protein
MSFLWSKEKGQTIFGTDVRFDFWLSMEYDQRVIVRFLYKENVQLDQIHIKLKA